MKRWNSLLLFVAGGLLLAVSASSTFTVNTTIEVEYDSSIEENREDLIGFFDGIYNELGIISCNNFTGRFQNSAVSKNYKFQQVKTVKGLRNII